MIQYNIIYDVILCYVIRYMLYVICTYFEVRHTVMFQ